MALQTQTLAWTLRNVPLADWPKRYAALKAQTSTEVGTPFSPASELIPIDTLSKQYSLDIDKLDALKQGRDIYVPQPSMHLTLAMQRLLPTDFILLVEFPIQDSVQVFGVMSVATFTWLTEATLFASAVILWLSLFWRDLSKLMRASDKVGNGGFTFDAKLRHGSALYPLSRSLDLMAKRIAALLEAHKSLTTAVSHELRNPLMRLHFRHQLARESEILIDKNRNLDLMADDLQELDRLADEMLTYAKLERFEPDIRFDTIELTPLIAHAVDCAQQLVLAQGKSVRIEQQLNLLITRGEPHYLNRALNNLLSNAVRHATSVVRITVDQSESETKIAIDDDGEGIAKSEHEKLFEPFARIDRARARHTGGFGMGLAITRRIARWHGGDVSISTSILGGARFVMSWPSLSKEINK